MPVEKRSQNTNGLPYLFSPSTDANKSAPLVLFLHGARNRGNDLNVLLKESQISGATSQILVSFYCIESIEFFI